MQKRHRTLKAEIVDSRTKVYQMILETIADIGRGTCPTKTFNFVFEPWRDAAKECNLQFRKGQLYAGNNHLRFPYIYMPESIVSTPNDTGDSKIEARGGCWIRAEYLRKESGYRLRRIGMQSGTVSTDDVLGGLDVWMKVDRLAKQANKKRAPKVECIKKATLDTLLTTYAKILAKKAALGETCFEFSGWQMDSVSHAPKRYLILEDTILDYYPEAPFDVLRNPNHLDSPLSCLLFCATLFSVSKPLLTAAKLPTEFLLQLTATNVKDFEKRFAYLHHWICYYCNPNNCDDIEKDYGSFEQEYVEFLSPIVHHNFPVLCRIASPYSKYYEPFMEGLCFTRKEAEQMKEAAALPILLSPIRASKTRTFEGCLTLDIPLRRNDTVFYKKADVYRKQLFEFYSGFITYLSKDPEACILQVKQFYSRALTELHCTKKTASEKQTQIACFLVAVHLAEEYAGLNNVMQTDLFLGTKTLLKSFVARRTATEADFARFLQELVDKGSDTFPLLLQDDHYLYLHFKEYWASFEDYCRSKDVLIQESAKAFRRKYLAAKFLKPQYTAKADCYPRYDCRKLIGSKKETVLIVKKSILQYARF